MMVVTIDLTKQEVINLIATAIERTDLAPKDWKVKHIRGAYSIKVTLEEGA